MGQCQYFSISMPISTEIFDSIANFDSDSCYLKFSQLACYNKLTNCCFFLEHLV